MVDATTAEVAVALREAGGHSLLLKGRTFARWLYEGEHREYGDADLLVRPDQLPRAESVLAGLGFEKHLDSADLPRQTLHSHTWVRPSDGAAVDLHWTLVGVGISADDLWRELARRTDTEAVAGRDLECVDTVARALHVALHAAQHGVRDSKPVEDLRSAARPLGSPRPCCSCAHPGRPCARRPAPRGASRYDGHSLRVLLDTSVFIAQEQARPLAVDRIPSDCAVSIVTATELELGVHLAADEGIRARRLATLNSLRSTYVPLPIDDAVGQAFAALVASLRRAGSRIGVQDAWIAATARAHGAGICRQDDDFDVVPGLAIIRV